MLFGGIVGGLRQPPMVSHPTMAAPVEGEPKCDLSFGGSLLGFCHMVAPLNQVGQTKNKVFPLSSE